MHFNPYGGPAAQVAADLANGVSIPGLSAEEAVAVSEWSLRLREVFAEGDPDVRIDLANRLLADSACRPYVSRHDGKPAHLHYASEHADQARRVRAYTAGGLAHLLCEDPSRMGLCAGDGCAVAFVDTSRNGRRRFCSTRCATRMHVADHRKRAAILRA